MNGEKFAPRREGTKQEKLGERPSKYSEWHRKLGAEFFSLDIDFVEYRKNKGIVAFMAVTGKLNDVKHLENSKRFIWDRTGLEREILMELTRRTGIPSYFVIHTDDLTVFDVHNLAEPLDKFQRMSAAEHADFVRKL